MNQTRNLPQQQHSISAIPNSLREQLQRAHLLLRQAEDADENGLHDVAAIKARQSATIFAAVMAHAPEAGSLAVLADMGYQGYEFETIEDVDGYVVMETRAFGISLGQRVVPTRTTTRRYFRGRVF